MAFGPEPVPLRVNPRFWRQTPRASLLVLFLGALGTVSSAACSSSNDGGNNTCLAEILCRPATAGLCGGPLVSSGPCQPCPVGYVAATLCTNDDAG